jgi:hypothetical protein
MHFGKYDQKLIELKIEHNVQLDNLIRIEFALSNKKLIPLGEQFTIFGFTYLLDEGYKQLANMNERYLQRVMIWSYFTSSLQAFT